MRYINADKLIRDLIDNRFFYPAIVKNAIEQSPTEDVVPRAEAEKLSIELEAMRGVANSYKMHYEKAKQEVAEQIFEEIEKYLQPNEDWAFEMKRQNQDCSEEYWGGKLSAFKQIRGFIDVNLKKKYIGE